MLPNALADVFVNSLSKFISRRGCPQIILSNNDSPFAADPTQQFVNNKNIQLKFALAKAPSSGGFWERLIGQDKRSLKKILQKSALDFYLLQTVSQKDEMILNSR